VEATTLAEDGKKYSQPPRPFPSKSVKVYFLKPSRAFVMAKIKVQTPIVELDGDGMTRILWAFIQDKLILPYLDVNLKYCDLSVSSRDDTNN